MLQGHFKEICPGRCCAARIHLDSSNSPNNAIFGQGRNRCSPPSDEEKIEIAVSVSVSSALLCTRAIFSLAETQFFPFHSCIFSLKKKLFEIMQNLLSSIFSAFA
jgi:hypothetical protein